MALSGSLVTIFPDFIASPQDVEVSGQVPRYHDAPLCPLLLPLLLQVLLPGIPAVHSCILTIRFRIQQLLPGSYVVSCISRSSSRCPAAAPPSPSPSPSCPGPSWFRCHLHLRGPSWPGLFDLGTLKQEGFNISVLSLDNRA